MGDRQIASRLNHCPEISGFPIAVTGDRPDRVDSARSPTFFRYRAAPGQFLSATVPKCLVRGGRCAGLQLLCLPRPPGSAVTRDHRNMVLGFELQLGGVSQRSAA
jgi:hypothetical protein